MHRFCGLTLASLTALVLAMPATAEDAALSWTPATENEDGTPYTDPQSTQLRWSLDPALLSVANDCLTPGLYCATVPHSQTSYTVTGLQSGTWHFAARSIPQSGPWSGLSNIATKTIDAAPNPPSGLRADGDLTAYSLIQSRDRFALIPVGRVAAGTACDPAQPVMGRYVVPRDAVTFTGTVQPQAVVASCSANF